MQSAREIARAAESGQVITVENLSRKFARSLARASAYALKDSIRELCRTNTNNAELRPDEFWALHNVSFSLARSEALAVIGSNGSGKSTLLKILSGLIKPDAGTAQIHGKVASIVELGAGFDPMLTGRENIRIYAALYGLSSDETEEILPRVINFSELADFIDDPLLHYSTGMTMRLAFAIIAQLNPDLLLIDEALAVGDGTFQAKCLRYLNQYREQGGALILVAHSRHHLEATCTSALLLEKGEVVYHGSLKEGLKNMTEASAVRRVKEKGESPLPRSAPGGKLSEISIEAVEFNPAGIVSGAPVKIEIKYLARQPIERAGFSVTIYSEDLAVCIAAFHCYEEIDLPLGKGSMTCAIDSISLAPGVFAVRTAIVKFPETIPLASMGWNESPKYFRVAPAPSEALRPIGDHSPLVRIGASWEKSA